MICKKILLPEEKPNALKRSISPRKNIKKITLDLLKFKK
jgi:hypothetical protein